MTSKKMMSVGAAIALVLTGANVSAANFEDMVSFRGFGTLGIVHSSEDQADFVSTLFQPDGAGHSRDWDMRPDTLLGGQVNLKFNDKFSAVVQAVAQHQYDKTFTPYIEWANIKYQVTEDLAVRAGRIVLPSFLVSDSRFVGFANPWVRPPQEVYFSSSITNRDGVDATYSFKTGTISNTVQAFWGNSKPHIPNGRIDTDAIYGANYTVESGDLKVRAGYVSYHFDLSLPDAAPLFAGFANLAPVLRASGFSAAASQSSVLATKYQRDIDADVFTLGANYDAGSYFVMGEAFVFQGDALLADATGGYLTFGYRVKAFTPYVTFSTIHSDERFEPGITTTGLPAPLAAAATALNAGAAALASNRTLQQTAMAGVRWDFRSGADLKVQYEKINLGDDSQGRLINTQPGFTPGGNVDLISIAVDFVF